MLGSIMRTVVSLVSGNMAYAPPRAPLRGYDSVARVEPYLMPLLSGSADGTGAEAGTYGRTTPYFWNARPALIQSDIFGSATQINSGRMAGHLLNPQGS